ncbi:hypothetical protein AVEN_74532-1 [Araneus ventricosus]|uniref:Uncharacterized protein n=1 Tax=Araneus ventricosus TaxID=182803 RepID=A0A4Y2GTW7_ARAVE|nr:hypothetical protein AVEN_74532-1 [Araneus ventricosus]
MISGLVARGCTWVFILVRKPHCRNGPTTIHNTLLGNCYGRMTLSPIATTKCAVVCKTGFLAVHEKQTEWQQLLMANSSLVIDGWKWTAESRTRKQRENKLEGRKDPWEHRDWDTGTHLKKMNPQGP